MKKIKKEINVKTLMIFITLFVIIVALILIYSSLVFD